MTHATALDELSHYIGMLQVDIRLGIDKRHLRATARLCCLLIDKIDAASPESKETLSQVEYKTLQLQLLDLQRAINVVPANPNPRARRAGKLRVIEGGQ